MELLQLREKEIFDTLNEIKDFDFVVIGGYAVNAYTLPRFSVDCDIVVKNEIELKKIENRLKEMNYAKISPNNLDMGYSKFARYEKEIKSNFKVSMDILIRDVIDRQTNSIFSAEWIFKNSEKRILRGKTIYEKLNLSIINPDALFVMKLLSCRPTDIRDLFMLVVYIKDRQWIKQEVETRYNFDDRILKLKDKISSKQFKDGLQGIYGSIDNKLFDKHKLLILELDK